MWACVFGSESPPCCWSARPSSPACGRWRRCRVSVGVVTDTVRDSEAVTAVTSTARRAPSSAKTTPCCSSSRAISAAGRCWREERSVVDKAVADLFDVLGPGRRAGARQAARVGAAGVSPSGRRRRDCGVRTRRARAVSPAGQSAAASRGRAHDRDPRPTFRAGAASGHRCPGPGQRVAAGRAAHHDGRARLCGARRVAPDEPRSSVRSGVSRAAPMRSAKVASRSGSSSTSRDELGELASAFNQMADDLAEFRRTNIGEVVRAKNTLEATLEALPDAVVLLDAELSNPVDESGRARRLRRGRRGSTDVARGPAPRRTRSRGHRDGDSAGNRDAVRHRLDADDSGGARRDGFSACCRAWSRFRAGRPARWRDPPARMT